MSFSQDWDMQSQAPPAKRETLLDSVERALYLKLTAQKRRYEILKGSDLWSNFMKLAEKYPQGKKCLVKVEKKTYSWEVTQILLDEREEPVKATTKAYAGYVLTAECLDISVQNLVRGRMFRILSLPEEMR